MILSESDILNYVIVKKVQLKITLETSKKYADVKKNGLIFNCKLEKPSDCDTLQLYCELKTTFLLILASKEIENSTFLNIKTALDLGREYFSIKHRKMKPISTKKCTIL